MIKKQSLLWIVCALFILGCSQEEKSIISPSVPGLETANLFSADDPFQGDEHAPITIVEFSDFQCPFCKRFYDQTLPQLTQAYINTGKVKFIFKNFPLSSHQFAENAAEAALCAKEQGKFWEYHDMLFKHLESLGLDSLKQWAGAVGLEQDAFNECLDSGSMKEKVQQDLKVGQGAGVRATPSFFINGKLLVGAKPFSDFKQVIDKETNT